MGDFSHPDYGAMSDSVHVISVGQSWGLALSGDNKWSNSAAAFLIPFGTLIFQFSDFTVSDSADDLIVKFGCETGLDSARNLPQHKLMRLPGTGKAQVTLTVDRSVPSRSTVEAVPVAAAKSFNWKCLLACAPTCATCLVDPHCWTICAAGCLVSCAIASALD